jgi:hypothetical protein
MGLPPLPKPQIKINAPPKLPRHETKSQQRTKAILRTMPTKEFDLLKSGSNQNQTLNFIFNDLDDVSRPIKPSTQSIHERLSKRNS